VKRADGRRAALSGRPGRRRAPEPVGRRGPAARTPEPAARGRVDLPAVPAGREDGLRAVAPAPPPAVRGARPGVIGAGVRRASAGPPAPRSERCAAATQAAAARARRPGRVRRAGPGPTAKSVVRLRPGRRTVDRSARRAVAVAARRRARRTAVAPTGRGAHLRSPVGSGLRGAPMRMPVALRADLVRAAAGRRGPGSRAGGRTPVDRPGAGRPAPGGLGRADRGVERRGRSSSSGRTTRAARSVARRLACRCRTT